MLPGLPWVKNIVARDKNLQGRGKATEFYFEQGKIDVLKEGHGKLKEFNTGDLARRNMSCQPWLLFDTLSLLPHCFLKSPLILG